MTIRELIPVLDARVLCGEDKLDQEVKSACGSDLMSDVLAFVKDKTVLITGLTNIHVMRTAEMLDIYCSFLFWGSCWACCAQQTLPWAPMPPPACAWWARCGGVTWRWASWCWRRNTPPIPPAG